MKPWIAHQDSQETTKQAEELGDTHVPNGKTEVLRTGTALIGHPTVSIPEQNLPLWVHW